MLRVAGAVGLAAALAWLVAPTSASGPEGMPRGFESGLRYLAPALVLGLALLPATRPCASASPALAARSRLSVEIRPQRRVALGMARSAVADCWLRSALSLVRSPSATRSSATTSSTATRTHIHDPGPERRLQVGPEHLRTPASPPPAPASTRSSAPISPTASTTSARAPPRRLHRARHLPAWRRLLNDGDYDYVVASRDRIEPGKPPYPPRPAGPKAPRHLILRKPPTWSSS